MLLLTLVLTGILLIYGLKYLINKSKPTSLLKKEVVYNLHKWEYRDVNDEKILQCTRCKKIPGRDSPFKSYSNDCGPRLP